MARHEAQPSANAIDIDGTFEVSIKKPGDEEEGDHV